MTLLHKTLAAARYDFARTMTVGRLSTLAVLAMFPPSLMTIIASFTSESGEAAAPVIGVTVMMVGMLALFLWATPIVHQELEGKTWSYIAVRPQGKLALLFGKYIVAVGWAMAVCMVAMSLSVLVVTIAEGQANHLRTWFVFAALIFMASFGYAAIYMLMGVVFHRRAMVIAVIYSIVIEGVMGNVPAVVNQFTLRHHFTALGIKWLEFDVGSGNEPAAEMALGISDPDWQNILIVFIATILALGATVAIIRNREYITSDET